MVKFRQYFLLLWKNYVLQKRRPISTAFEIILPTFFILILAVIKTNPNLKEETRCANISDAGCSWSRFRPTDGLSENEAKEWLDFGVDLPILLETPPFNKTKKLAFTPNTTLTQRIMTRAMDIIINATQVPSIIEAQPFKNETEMVNYLVELNNNASFHRINKLDIFNYSDYLGAVVFKFSDNAETLPVNIDYQIRLNSRPRLCALDPTQDSGINTDPSLECTWLTQLAYPLYPLQVLRDEKYRQTDRQIENIRIDRQTDEQETDGWTDTQTDRQKIYVLTDR
ncbi:phospholipid-transporting ATPase ABCA3-like [Corticium candelabrum]|uniref:phospholipid-transporting ATPase ABCA3-like n=1 Tax=Corticium candelabrum TaxID=121492 RepID=UPI002E269182|nr:phospholipid-transporting ATPase ABCA3-like [Corticium candelabrum]